MKIKAEPLYLWNLTQAEFSSLIDNHLISLRLLKEEIELDNRLQNYLSRIESQFDVFFHSYNPQRASSETILIVDASGERQVAFRALKTAISLSLMAVEARELEDAVAVNFVFKRYKSVTRLGYGPCGERISGLLMGLDDESLAGAIARLQLQRHIERLRKANDTMMALMLRRSKALDLKPRVNIMETRRELMETYRDMVDYVVAMAKLDTPGFVRILTAINTIRKEHALVLARRRGVAAAKKKRENEELVEVGNN